MMRSRTSRPGMATFSIMLVVLMFFVLAAMLLQSIAVTDRRVQVQTAADQMARASARELATCMNELVEAQHSLGQAHALAILDLAHGGDELLLPQGSFDLDASLQAIIDAELARASLKWPGPTVGPDVTAHQLLAVVRSRSGGAIGRSRRTLRQELARSLARHALANDPVAARSERRRQELIADEWQTIAAIEDEAMAVWAPRGALLEWHVVPGLAQRVSQVVQQAPTRVQAINDELARQTSVTITRSPTAMLGRGQLPVHGEGPWIDRHGWERSAIVRVTTPWVQHDRQPTLEQARRLIPISNYAEHYRDETNRGTIERSRHLRSDQGITLMILADTTTEKGAQRWVNRHESIRVDELFGLGVQVERAMPNAVGRVVFGGREHWTMQCQAQAMIHPRPQRATSSTPDDMWQPTFAWDTLQWSTNYRAPEWLHGLQQESNHMPRPRWEARWQAKLTPWTAKEPSGSQP